MALMETPPSDSSPCPSFRLPAVDGNTYALEDFKEKEALVVLFICNHCPYVQAVEDRLIQLAKEMKSQSVQFLAVCSNDEENYPEDSFENLKKRWAEKNYDFPYLHDKNQGAAKSFGAVCTPDIFVYNKKRRLAYRGRLDDSWKDEAKVTRRELKEAIEEILDRGQVSFKSHPSMGCSIKWL